MRPPWPASVSTQLDLLSGDPARPVAEFATRMRGLETDVRRHIELASRLGAGPEDTR